MKTITVIKITKRENYSGKRLKKSITILQKKVSQIKKMSRHSTENFYHKYMLIEAEIYSLQGKMIKASDLYDSNKTIMKWVN